MTPSAIHLTPSATKLAATIADSGRVRLGASAISLPRPPKPASIAEQCITAAPDQD